MRYLADTATATTVYLAAALEQPLLVEGPAGVGKTELAKAVATATGAELIRLQCYEGLDEARALYEWNYRKQLLRIQAARRSEAWDETHDDIFTDEFLLTRPLLTAIRRDGPTVLLIDEADKTDVEVEALLLEVLSEFQVTIPELGTVRGHPPPVRRRHLQRHPRAVRGAEAALPVPAPRLPDARARARHRAGPGARARAELADQLARTAATLRAMELKKAPSIAETIDWARTLLALGIGEPGRGRDRAHPGRRPQAPLRPRAGGQGTRPARPAGLSSRCSTGTSASSPRCARPG